MTGTLKYIMMALILVAIITPMMVFMYRLLSPSADAIKKKTDKETNGEEEKEKID